MYFIFSKKTSEINIVPRVEPEKMKPKVDLNLDPKLEVFTQVSEIEEEEDDDDDE